MTAKGTIYRFLFRAIVTCFVVFYLLVYCSFLLSYKTYKTEMLWHVLYSIRSYSFANQKKKMFHPFSLGIGAKYNILDENV